MLILDELTTFQDKKIGICTLTKLLKLVIYTCGGYLVRLSTRYSVHKFICMFVVLFVHICLQFQSPYFLSSAEGVRGLSNLFKIILLFNLYISLYFELSVYLIIVFLIIFYIKYTFIHLIISTLNDIFTNMVLSG